MCLLCSSEFERSGNEDALSLGICNAPRHIVITSFCTNDNFL